MFLSYYKLLNGNFFYFTSPVGGPQGHLLCYKVLIMIIIIFKTLKLYEGRIQK